MSSEPIVVEGIIYRLLLFPKGHKEAEGTHISVGLHWNFVNDFAVDPPSYVLARCTMLHGSGDRSGDFSVDREVTDMMDERGARSFGDECKFYLQHEVAESGFVHNDGNLKFIFQVKKNNISIPESL